MSFKCLRILILALVVVLLLPVASDASAMLCGFECNIQDLDICVHTGEPGIRCWQITGGCISGGYPKCADQFAW